MKSNLIGILLIVFSVVLAGFFAGSEMGIYQLSRLRLRLGIEKKRFAFVILGKCLHDSSALLLSMLIGTNLAYYLATSVVTYMLLTKLGAEHTVEFVATLFTAPILFVFSELIPKNLFLYRADALMPAVAPVLFGFHKFFIWCGAVPFLKGVLRIFAKFSSVPMSAETAITSVERHKIAAILQESREEALLSSVQSDIVKRLVVISNIRISSVMTAINNVQIVEVSSDRSALLKKLKECAFTRLPVYDRWPENIVGFVNIYEALCCAGWFSSLHSFVKPIRKLSAETVVSDAIEFMQSENEKIVLVTKAGHLGRENPVGIVTMKDLVEELLGELSEW
jgi:CBS domain containing-hemolysin-like protein